MKFSDGVGNPLIVASNALFRLSISCYAPKMLAVKVATCEVVEKRRKYVVSGGLKGGTYRPTPVDFCVILRKFGVRTASLQQIVRHSTTSLTCSPDGASLAGKIVMSAAVH